MFDGFNNIPTEHIDSIKAMLLPLFNLENARFLFSGTKEEIKELLPEGIIARQTNEILRFQHNDVKDYLESINPDLSKYYVDTIY